MISFPHRTHLLTLLARFVMIPHILAAPDQQVLFPDDSCHMSFTLLFLRIAAVMLGTLCLYISIFLYKNQEVKIQRRNRVFRVPVNFRNIYTHTTQSHALPPAIRCVRFIARGADVWQGAELARD